MFRTELTIAPAARPLPRTARILTLGSCFAESIGQRLTDNKVSTLVNPFGTTYQPLALARLLRAAAGDAVDWPQHIVEARGRWQTYDLPGRFGAHSPVELLQDIEEAVYHAGTFLRNADVVLLTLGTAWAYRLRETGELVNNCHKMPAELFERELLTADDIINALAETHAYLRRLNPKLRVVLTVSPVRHLRDTLPLNAVSKAVLRVACHYLSELLPDVTYFPAYELLTDDLRDYRFYGADMLHPSAVAEDYIWDKFAQAFFDADFATFRREWGGLRQALAHRPLHEAAPEHRHFLTQTAERLGRLATLGHAVGHELAEVQTRIAALPEPRTLAAAPEPADDGQERIDIGPAQATAPAANLDYRDATGRTAALQALEDAADARAAALDEARQRATDRAAELAVMAAESSVSHPGTPAPQAGRPGRLSPEEFRQQRAEKGRGGRNNRRNERNAPVQPPATPAAQNAAETAASGSATVPAQTPTKTPPLAAAPAVVALGTAVPPLPLAAEGSETGKKKKRRSRGGAKRTARKNAARLAETDATDSTAPAATTPAVPVSPAKSSVIQKSEPNLRSQRQKRTNAPTAPAVPTAPVASSVTPVPVAASTATVPSLAESVLGLKPKKVAGEYASAVSAVAPAVAAPVVVAPAVVSPPAKANRRRPAPAPSLAATAAVAPTAAVAAVPVVPAPVAASAPPKTAARKPKPGAATPAKAAPPVAPEAPAAAKQPATAKTVASGAKPAKAAVKAAPAKVVAISAKISAKKEPASSKQNVAPAKPEAAPAKAKTAAPKKAATPVKPKAAAATAVPKAAKAAPANATKPAAKKPSK